MVLSILIMVLSILIMVLSREKMVGTTKRCLRKVLGQSSLTEEQLNTTLISIEAAVNWRPNTQCGDSEALTPAHF